MEIVGPTIVVRDVCFWAGLDQGTTVISLPPRRAWPLPNSICLSSGTMDQNLGDKAAPSLAAVARLPRVGVDRSRAMGQVLVRGDPGGAAGGGRRRHTEAPSGKER